MNSTQDLWTLRQAMDQLFQDNFNRMSQPGYANGGANDNTTAALTPRADAWESSDELMIELSLPGVNPDDVDIVFEQDTLTIQGNFQNSEEGRNWVLRERPRGTFRRRFTLQVPVDVEKVEANYQNGILSLRLPKSEVVKPRKISVKSGG